MASSEQLSYPATVDLSNCDKEPIHLLGNIQSHGCLLALKDDWTIACCSANTKVYFEQSPQQMLHTPLKSWIDRTTLHHLRTALQSSMITGRNERLFQVKIEAVRECMDISVHHNGQYILLEFEKNDGNAAPSGHLVRSLLSQFYCAEDSADLMTMVAEQLRLVTGFDRVMVYRFLPDGAGEVAAESKIPDLEAFHGLRYPASDIPKQARELYKKNLLRVIGDVNDPIVPLISGADNSGQAIDLSFSTLRAVSPIHIEYLKNMGVGASLSVSIIIRGELWGLIACHHYSPKVPSYFQRTELELFAEVFALELASRLSSEREVEQSRAQEVHTRIMSRMASQGAVIDIISSQVARLQDLINSDGIAVLVDGQKTGHEAQLSEDSLGALTRYLKTQSPASITVINSLAQVIPGYDTPANKIAGVLAVPVSRSPRDYLLFYRLAQTQTINWAGNPQKPVSLGPHGERLLPRTSFELWRETHQDRCHDWSAQNIRDGEALRVTLLEVVLRHVQDRDVLMQQASRKHEILISELNHRVRNILNLVNAIIMQTEQNGRSLDEFVNVLTGRLVALASAHDQLTASEWSDISFAQLIDTEIQAYVDVDIRVERSGPDVNIDPEAATSIVLVIHELFTNAAKYGALSNSKEKGLVSVQWEVGADGLMIKWQETGGPPVSPPTREGFGMTIIRSVIPHELDGKVDLQFAPTGINAMFVVPSRFIGSLPDKTPAIMEIPLANSIQYAPLPAEALVVEDSLVIALDMQKKLKAMGITHVSVVGNVKTAKQTYERRNPGLVVFDIHLGKETTLGLMQSVLNDNVPCLIISGYGEQLQLPAEFSNVPVLTKPVQEALLKETLHTLFSNPDLKTTGHAE